MVAFTKAIALLALISCNILRIRFALESAVGCPEMCDCYSENDNNTLAVDCGDHRGLNESVLAQQLDLLLSDKELIEYVTSLNISNTPLTTVPMPVCQMTNLRRLILNDNRLSRLPDNCFANMTALVWLSASRNNITELQDGLFDGLSSLEKLDLSENTIASIGLRVFSNPNDLVNLWLIRLDGNRLRSLEPWPYIRGLHGSVDSAIYIFLTSNFITEFTNNIEWQFNCSHPSYAKVDITRNYIMHITDILHGWNVGIFHWYCIMQLGFDSTLHFRALAFKVDYAWSYDHHCDCFDVDLLMVAKNTDTSNYLFKDVICSRPPTLANQSVNRLPLDEFVCEVPDRCPPSCRCVYRHSNFTFHVYCSAANLSSLPLDLPSLHASYATYKLDFSSNKLLERLEYRPYFVNTSILDVSNSAIDVVDLSAWRGFAAMPSELYALPLDTLNLTLLDVTPVVFLHGNKLESLSVDVTDINLTSVHVTLNDNPWRCSCDNRWMIAWFKSFSGTTSNALCASPPRLKGSSILQSDETDFCVDPSARMLTIVLSCTTSVVAGLLLLGVAVYRLRVRLYRRWKFHPFDRDECVGEDMDYDVFLCCSSDDESPHGLRILHLIESKGCRVCYHERDFLPGSIIADSVIQSIVCSKRTVCFVSSNFLRR